MAKRLSDLRRARGLIQQAYSKVLGRFGTQSEVLDLLSEALKLIKDADVPGGIVDVADPVSEERPASSTTPAEPSGSVGDGTIEVEATTTTEPEPPARTPFRRGTGRKK